MKKKTIQTVWETWTYDVWGNEKEGFEVNDRYNLEREYPLTLEVEVNNPGTDLEFLSASPSDDQIREALDIRSGYPIETDGDDLVIYVRGEADGYPLGELHCVSHSNLSPIREV